MSENNPMRRTVPLRMVARTFDLIGKAMGAIAAGEYGDAASLLRHAAGQLDELERRYEQRTP